MDREEMNRILGMTEEEIDRRAQEFEDDAWDSSQIGEVIMGRPRLFDEEVLPVTVRLPISQINAIDQLAASKSTTRSAEIRSAIGAWVAAS